MVEGLKGEVESIAFGGKGIVRHQGLVVFVPYTAPGDKILFEITKLKHSFAEGKLVQLLEPSQHRIKPRCPYFGLCGGCQLQHLNYGAQLESKRIAIQDIFKRIGGVDGFELPPVVPSEAQWGFRRKIALHLKRSEKGFLLGYYGDDNTTLIPVKQCAIFLDDTAHPLFQNLSEAASEMAAEKGMEGSITILKRANDTFLLLFQYNRLPKNIYQIIENTILHLPYISGVIVKAPRKFKTYGETEEHAEIDGLSIHFSAEAFIQNHPEQSLNIYRLLASLVKNGPVLDLYSGVGITSLMLARKGLSVESVEGNPVAVAMAVRNAKENGLNSIGCHEGDVNVLSAKLLQSVKPQTIVLNPPREGVDANVLRLLAAEGISELFYISCMPSTLARDLKILLEAGYKIKMCQAFDMFPQTGHVETLVHLSRN